MIQKILSFTIAVYFLLKLIIFTNYNYINIYWSWLYTHVHVSKFILACYTEHVLYGCSYMIYEKIINKSVVRCSQANKTIQSH